MYRGRLYKKLLIGLVLVFLLVLTTVNAQVCEQKETFLARLRDTCSFANGICEDAENPISHKDCSFTVDVLSCKGNRCMFTELWFAKILVIALLFIIIFHKKDYNLFIILIILILALNFANSEEVDTLKKDLNKMAPTTTLLPDIEQERINENLVMQYGQKVMPSNPQFGFFIIVIFVYIGFKYLSERRSRK